MSSVKTIKSNCAIWEYRLDAPEKGPAQPVFIDAHAHLDRYGATLKAAMDQIVERQIFTVANAMDIPSYQQGREIGTTSDWVLPTFGVHPKNAGRYAGNLGALRPFIDASPAIGEIGLDFYWVKEAALYPAQRKVFEYFMAAAREQNKIINLHTKGAEKEIFDRLEHYGLQRAIVHWYSGPLDVLRAMIDAGLYFTVGVELLFSDHIREVARTIPLRQLITETDNPGGLKWLSGRTGMPADLQRVVAALADLKAVAPEFIKETVHKNFLRLVSNDPWLEKWRGILTSG
jgi:TatD DNase family protein